MRYGLVGEIFGIYKALTWKSGINIKLCCNYLNLSAFLKGSPAYKQVLDSLQIFLKMSYMDNSNKHTDDETIVISFTAAILIFGFCIVAFYSGPAGLITTLVLLSMLCAYYAFRK